jgi:rhodanese-related sulfurtransferase
MTQQNIIPIVTLILSVVLGICIALFVPSIRFTQYVEPVRFEVSPTQARAEMLASGSGHYLFFDVRSLKEYNELHAMDAKSVPIADLYNLWRSDLPRTDKQIYLICTSGRLAAVAYDFLEHHGYRNIRHIEWGIQQWIVENQPVVAKDIFQ